MEIEIENALKNLLIEIEMKRVKRNKKKKVVKNHIKTIEPKHKLKSFLICSFLTYFPQINFRCVIKRFSVELFLLFSFDLVKGFGKICEVIMNLSIFLS